MLQLNFFLEYIIIIDASIANYLFCYSFHVGSDPDGNGCKDPTVHQAALRMSTELFDYALSIGYKLSLLDIGGGYPGLSGSENIFFYITKTIAECLVQFKAKFPTAEIISEPGKVLFVPLETVPMT